MTFSIYKKRVKQDCNHYCRMRNVAVLNNMKFVIIVLLKNKKRSGYGESSYIWISKFLITGVFQDLNRLSPSKHLPLFLS